MNRARTAAAALFRRVFLINGLIFAGVGAGSGLTPPLLNWIITHHGWRAAFWFSALLGTLIGAVWWFASRNTPEQHPRVTPAELAEIRAGMAGQLGPEAFETVVGRAEIREVFSAGKIGRAAGLLVVDGVIRKALKARITRADVIIYQGEIASLRRFKDDVPEVRAGLECGVTFTQNFTDIKPGDFLETYEVELRERTL